MKTYKLLLCLLISNNLFSQQPLSKSARSSIYTYIYQVSPNEALTLYKTNLKKIDRQYLHTFIDSFPTLNDIPQLRNGNYILFKAAGNRLQYDLITSGDLQLKLINNKHDLNVMLHDKKGKIIKEAKVQLNGRQLKYDKYTMTYRLNKQRKTGNLQVIHANTAYYFPLQTTRRKQGTVRNIAQKLVNVFPLKYITKTVRRWQEKDDSYTRYFDNPVPYEMHYKGFMTFSKPIYKPGDTVKLKAFVMNKKGKGLNKRLLVRLTDRYFDFDTVIAVIKPYRPGGYIHEFVLDDSIDLDLDKDYIITLEEQSSRKYDLDEYDGDLEDDEYAGKRKVVMRGKFNYEEYELETINFTARTDNKEHNRGNKLSIFLKATDENDLPVMDGRLQITVLPFSNNTITFSKPEVFLPDTLWTHEQALESVGETKINIPDSIFPNASFSYQIECVLLNSNNERHTQYIYASFNDKKEIITFRQKQDSLTIDFEKAGIQTKAQALIYAYNDKDDTLQIIKSNLPVTIKLNPYASHYEAITQDAFKRFELKHTKGMVSALATRTKDSLFILLNNPERLSVWHTLFAGNKVISRGYADSLALNTRTITPKNYSLSIQYIYGNKMYSEDYTIPYQDKLLNLTVNGPRVIYPGQTAQIEISVTDVNNKAIEGADITAYSFTRKFSNTNTPHIPYLGKIYPYRKQCNNFMPQPTKDWKHQIKLNWEYWSKELGLDTIEYYKFLYPNNFYYNKEFVKDSSTQIAPFVVIKGELQPIHLLYIDNKPHYFSQSQQLQRYSFKVDPGKHGLRIRTHDKIITLHDVYVPKGFKTIISINGDTSNKTINVQKAPDTLTIQEKALLNKYTILINNDYGEHLSYIKQGDNIFLLPKPKYAKYNDPSLISPLLPNMAELVVKDNFQQPFEVEGGYLYQIRPGLIKQKEVNTNSHYSISLSNQMPIHNFSDLVLTGQEVDSLWKEYLDTRSANNDLFFNSTLSKQGNGALHIALQKTSGDNDLFIKNIFLFRYEDTDFIRVYKGSTNNLGYLTPGTYRLFILLKDNNYIIRDSILIRKGGVNHYAIYTNIVKPADSISRKMDDVIKKRTLTNRNNPAGLDQLIESFNSGYLDASSFNNIIRGRLVDTEGNLIPGATVIVKGTQVGTLTDDMGYYKIKAPSEGTLVFSAVGFTETERNISDEYKDVVMFRVSNELQEVVVVGYGTTRKQSLTSSVSVLSEGIAGGVPGISIRGAGTNKSNPKPLIIVDGIPYEGNVDDLDPALVANITTMKADVAQAIYGSKAANGVLLITTKGTTDATKDEGVMPGQTNSLRRRFRDDAYWQPTLRTDAEGKVRFSTTFPDDITNWRTYAIAIANHKRTGYSEGLIRSFKPISTNLSLPNFAVAGDSLNVIGKTLNYGSDSLKLSRRIKINDRLIKEGTLHFQNAFIDTVSLTVAGNDSIRFHLEVRKEDGYFDGEERTIPVFKQGVIETKGFFAALEGDTTLTIKLDPALGPIKLYAEASLLPVLLDETEQLHRYEYLCNEQLASKLKALIAQKKIYALLKKEFENEKVILDIITRLNSNRTGNLWGWWSNNEPAPWISLHVVEALLKAEKEGYKVYLPKTGIIDNLIFNMENYRGRDKLLSLHLLQQLNAKVNYQNYIDSLEKRVDKLPLYDKLRLIELKQKAGIEVSIDSIITKAKHTLFGNMYWGEEGYQFFDNDIHNTLLMYRILAGRKDHETTLRKIRNYFLEKRKDGQWRNTYESSLILETILPDLLTKGEMPSASTLTISNEQGKVINSFPFHKEIQSTEPLTINKKGDLPIYFTAFQQSWNKIPTVVAGAFTVHTNFEKGGSTLTSLKAGEPVGLKVQVSVKGDADYVMIEIPIPAGCSYKDKPQPYYNNEVHREYFKNKVSIFCSSLKQGSYTFTIPLLPRYTGRYHLNPAKAEMMYFPVFYGRESIKQISIK